MRKHARLAQQISEEVWVLWVRFSLHLIDSIDEDEMEAIDRVMAAIDKGHD